MNNLNMNINMGGPVGGLGGQMPMMNNGVPVPQPAQQQQRHQRAAMDHRILLNTYVYEYFLRNNMLECARAMVQSEVPIHYNRKEESDMNGMGSDPMDTDSKDAKLAGDLPEPAVPQNTDGCFLYDWFCLFWEMFNAQRGKSNHAQINQYIDHTQTQSRLKQTQQQEMLRNLRPDQLTMMRNMNMNAGAAMMKQNSLARTAMANNQNPTAMMMQAKQNQMPRDPSDMDGNRPRPGSPSSTENAPSPSKRPRLDGPQGFNPNQPGIMPNGRPAQGAPQQVGSGPNSGNNAQLLQMLLSNGIAPNSLTQQQFQTFANQPPVAQAKSIQAYAQNLSQHQSAQMPNKQMPNPGGPQVQGSPMMAQGPDGTAALNAYYNPNEMGAGGMRPGPGGAQASGGSNHALQDYQMQLMLLEQQNKKRLMMARQEQDNPPNSMQRADGPPGLPGPPGVANGQPFPAGERAAGSPNPADQMKRGTPQMNNAGMPSPLPEGAQSRGSPNTMNFMPNQMDPNGAPAFYKPGMEGNMAMNGAAMRAPSSHPNPQFNGQQVAPAMMAARQQQPGAPGGPGMQWQGGPQGGPQGPQGPQQQGPRPVQNVPAGAMAPPAPPAGNNATNARNQTSSPQNTAQPPTPSQANKPNPKKKDSKSAKDKRGATQKKSANHNAGATPAPENTQENEPPTPATPITPGVTFATKGAQPAPAAQSMPNGQTPAAAPAPAQVAPQPSQDPNQNGAGFGMDSNMNPEFPLTFADPLASNDVLDSFDFESFLHDEDGNVGPFDFNTGFGPMEAEINAD